MDVGLVVLGLIFDLVGVCMLVLATLFRHQKINRQKWQERYFFSFWTLDFRKGKPLFRNIDVAGGLPPKHICNIIGLFLVISGFLLQIIGNLR